MHVEAKVKARLGSATLSRVRLTLTQPQTCSSGPLEGCKIHQQLQEALDELAGRGLACLTV